MRYGYLSPKLAIRTCSEQKGKGIFASERISAGELLCVFGGRAVHVSEFNTLSKAQQTHSLQVAEDIYLVTDEEREEVDFFNHSCSPNAGLQGQICLVALRDIEAGEEVCFDYAMSDGCDYDEFICHCGSENCRGMVRGDDWKNQDLQRRYQNHFSPYLQQRIEKMKINVE